MQIKLVAFDVNGTLFDDTGIFWQAINGIFPKYGKAPLSLATLRERFGQPWTSIYREFGISEEVASEEELYKIYNDLYQRLGESEPSPGLRDALGWLMRRNIKLAVVSTQQNSITIPLLEKNRLSGVFFKVRGSVSDKAAALREITNFAGIVPERTAYVGDQEGDVRHAKKAGCVSIAFCGGVHGRERLARAKPDFIIDSMEELKNLPIF